MVSFGRLVIGFVSTFLIDKLGRKRIMLISLIGMGLSCFGISIFKIIGDNVGAIIRILSYYQRKYII